VNKCVIGALALALALGGCAGHRASTAPTETSELPLVPLAALDRALLSPSAVDQVMGTTGMTPHKRVTVMDDHRDLLPNLNCLGIWQVDDAGVYGKDGWIAVRQELLRSPDVDQWDNLVVQSVISYPSAEDARKFFDQSADRWPKCTNHHVNITVNGQPLPKWTSGQLTTTDSQLSIPVTRGTGDQTRSCQRALKVSANVIIDVQTCTPPAPTATQAATIAERIESALPK
jgi:PknH-like extracellular domain